MSRAVKTRSGWVEVVVREYQRGLPLALFFDYDGTLTPIVQHPRLARLAPGTRDRLCELSALPRIGVGIISGRSLADVRSMVALDGVYYAGSGGLEIDHLGRIERYPDTEAIGTLLESIEVELEELLELYPGTWLERKPGAIAIHFRRLLPVSACCFRLDAVQLLSSVVGLRFRIVSQAIEVTLLEGWDKGTAVVSILNDMRCAVAAAPLAIYFGDSANDAEGMTAALQTGGVAVGVGAEAPDVAIAKLDDTRQLVELLEELTGRLGNVPGRTEAGPTALARPPQQMGVSDPMESDAGRNAAELGLLVLDPDPEARSAYAPRMRALGWQVFEASTVSEAVAWLERHHDRIQIVQVDLQLPGLQGAMAMAAIGRAYPRLFRCFVSADVRPYLASAFDRMSRLPLLVKPLEPEDCDLRFRAWLEKEKQPLVPLTNH